MRNPFTNSYGLNGWGIMAVILLGLAGLIGLTAILHPVLSPTPREYCVEAGGNWESGKCWHYSKPMPLEAE